MHAKRQPARPGLEPYERQARKLLEAHPSRDPEALRSVRQYHPRLRGRADTNDLFELAERKPPVEVADERWAGTALDWALYAWTYPPPEARRARHHEVVALLVAAGAKVDPEWLGSEKLRGDPRMRAALRGKRPPRTE